MAVTGRSARLPERLPGGRHGCHRAINHADVLLILGTDFPFSSFLPHGRTRPSRGAVTAASPCSPSALLTEVQRRAHVVHIVLNNSGLDFVKIEQQEAGFAPFGTDFANPDFAAIAEAAGAKVIRVEDPGDVRGRDSLSQLR